MAGPFGKIGSTTLNLAAVKGTTYLGNKATEAAKGLLSDAKGAFFSEAPGFAAGAGYMSRMRGALGGMFGNNGSGTGSTQTDSLRPILLQQTSQLRSIANNTAQSNRISVASDRNAERRAIRNEKKLDEVKKAVKEGGGGFGLGALGDLLSERLKAAIGIIAGLGAGAAALAYGQKAFGRSEKRGRSSRLQSSLATTRIGVLSRAKASSSVRTGASGATVAQKEEAIATRDDATREVLQDGFTTLAKESAKIAKNTKIDLGNEQARARYRSRATRQVDTRTADEKLRDKIEERFTRGFQAASTRAFTKAITDSLGNAFPDLKRGTVSKSAASGEFYIGEQLAQATGLQKGTQKLFEKMMGKEYGSMFAPVFSELATGIAQRVGQGVGTALFSGVLGEEGARTLTGQMIGNFQKGNKATAYEQLLYGMTGIAAGPETIFAKYGFGDTTQGIGYIAGELGARTTEMMQGITGFGGNVTRPTGPKSWNNLKETNNTGVRSTLGSEDIARQNEAIQQQIETQGVMEDGYASQDKRFKEQQDVTYQTTDSTNTTLSTGFQGVQTGLSNLASAMSGIGGGGGTSIGIGIPGMGGGMSPFSSMMVDLGASFLTQSLTKKIKNPFLRAVANVGGQLAFSSVGRSLITGGSVTGGLSNVFGVDLSGMGSIFGGGGNVVAFDPTMNAGMSYANGNVAGAGTTNHLANLPYYYAAYQALTGDVKGAAMTAGSYYAGSALAGTLIGKGVSASIASGLTTAGMAAGTAATVGSAIVTGGLSLVVGAVLGGLFGGRKRRPPPSLISRAIQIEGNNNINAKVTIYDVRGNQELANFADALLNVAFNTIKMFEQAGYQLGKNEKIHYIEMHINNQSHTRLRIHTQPYTKYKEGDYYYDYGKPADTSGKNVGNTASRIVKSITQLYKEKNQSASAKADEISSKLNQKSFAQLASGTIVELRKMDAEVTKGVISDNLALQEALSKSLIAEQNKQGVGWGNNATEGSKQYQGSVIKEMRTEDNGDSTSTVETGNYLIWQDGKYVKLTQDLADKYGLNMTYTPATQTSNVWGDTTYTPAQTTVDTSKIIGVTPTGIPILDVDASGSITVADYEALISKFGYEQVTGASAQVNNVSDNSTTVNNFGLFSADDPFRNTSASTRLPLAA